MRAVVFAGFVLLAVASPGFAQAGDPNHERSLVPPEALFEVVQSPLAAQNTFRLNRVTGQVDQLVVRSADDERGAWQRMAQPVDLLASTDGHPTYYMFTSGLAARWTFLVNTRTGATWQLFRDSETKGLFWRRMLER